MFIAVINMRILQQHAAWLEFVSGRTKVPTKKKPLSESQKIALRIAMEQGCTLHWIDSWADGIIKTDYPRAALEIADADTIIDATIGWIFDWEITYTFYMKTQLGEYYDKDFVYVEKNTTINALTDTVNNVIRIPAKETLNQLHIYDEGWKARIIGGQYRKSAA